jgi:Mg2+ and Co2+ transporter CorA
MNVGGVPFVDRQYGFWTVVGVVVAVVAVGAVLTMRLRDRDRA